MNREFALGTPHDMSLELQRHGRYNDVTVAIGDYLACESGVAALC